MLRKIIYLTIPVLLIASSEKPKPEPTIMTNDQCWIYTRAAAHAMAKSFKVADKFDAFGTFRDIVLMEDIESEESKTIILQTAVCNYLCDPDENTKHAYCKILQSEMEFDDMAKASLFKSVIKKKESLVKPALSYAKAIVAKLLKNTSSVLNDEEAKTKIDQQIKDFVDKNFDLSKVGSVAQKLLNKFNINFDLESQMNDDPKKMLETGKMLFGKAQEHWSKFQKSRKGGDDGKNDGKMNMDFSSFAQYIPKAKEMFAKMQAGNTKGLADEASAAFNDLKSSYLSEDDDDNDYEDETFEEEDLDHDVDFDFEEPDTVKDEL